MKFPLIRQIFWSLLLLGIFTTFIFLGLGSFTSPTASATVTKLEAVPGEILYRSQTKLDDQAGHVWQAVLFKQVYPGQATSLNLRLVGFPNSAELIHPQPLKITTASGKVLTAADVFLDEAPAPTIGQYNFKDILPQLPNEALQLGIPLPGQHFINISVPQSVVSEWHEVMTSRE
ncbi:DUF3122 domain-containing protein [Nostoc sp. FACHB-152]|uniref:DUF3122 domain-containing protein n=1 Tax=unclassified Nostoc TaxID=2593658 RepID=UPI0016837B28|nr:MULTISPECIES: DUF3122 domain-containing protein [unclassified Nostoc]MBD2449879.1 DUF3122 domain-containing protein [Nostoc sp. FACHB-152]MBD2467107.1 DUF3122 domain-containing protein [Nostoc sp. FACHB-145]